jgi:ABC-type transport system involved in cytochrome bd biosynthesis fused ATPase/permease subunit
MKVFIAVLSIALVACALGQELVQTPGEINFV